ncbi:MAG: hypothetical protein J6C89_02950, partial [Clostridia bacterium]|nr:hypothetical protein [Clostridia bacterium]
MAIKKDKNGNFYIVNDEKSEKEKAAVSSAAKTIKTDKDGNFYIEAGSEAKQEFPLGNRYFSSGDGKVLTTQ